MYKVCWNWFVAMMEVVVSLKMRIAKYIACKSNKRVYANGVNMRFQYFLIYCN